MPSRKQQQQQHAAEVRSGSSGEEQHALAALRLYKYAAVDKSPLSYYVLTPFWNYATTLFPRWVAPNLITLTGLGFILLNVLTIELVLPDLVGPGPSWVYVSFAVGLFLYQTFDNVDGKQARRTGSSSPLGELFDHGIDALNCTLGGVVMCASLGFGSSLKGAVVVVISSWPMFFSSWEQYHTGVLYLGYFNGPTEGILIACVCMLVSAVCGPSFWHRPAVEHFGPGSRWLLGDVDTSTLFVVNILFALFVVHIPFCVFNVHVARARKGLDTASTLLQWIPILLFTSATVAWLTSPYSTVLRDNHLVLLAASLCLVFGRMTTKIILAHLLRQPFPMYTVMLAPLVLGAALVNAPSLGLARIVSEEGEVRMLWGMLGLSIVLYGHWALGTIRSFTDYLGISCLTIPYPADTVANKKHGKA